MVVGVRPLRSWSHHGHRSGPSQATLPPAGLRSFRPSMVGLAAIVGLTEVVGDEPVSLGEQAATANRQAIEIAATTPMTVADPPPVRRIATCHLFITTCQELARPNNGR